MRRVLMFALSFGCAVGCLGPPLPIPPGKAAREKSGAAKPIADKRGGIARAYRIERPQDLPVGALVDAKLGDIRLESSRAVFIIDAANAALGFAESGGNLVDMFAVTPTGYTQDSIKQVFGYLDNKYPRQPSYGKVDIIKSGESAIVRAEGFDSQNPNLQITTEYTLLPASAALEVSTEVTNVGADPVRDYAFGDAIEWGRTEPLWPGVAEPSGTARTRTSYLLGLGEQTAYAYMSGKPHPLSCLGGDGWSDIIVERLQLPPGASATVKRYWIVTEVSDANFGASAARLRNEEWVKIEGKVVEEVTGRSLAGARLYFEDTEGRPLWASMSRTEGYRAQVPQGDYLLRVELSGRRGPAQLLVRAQRGTPVQRDILVTRAGRLRLRLESPHVSGLAGKVTLLGLDDTPTPRLGPRFAAAGENVVLVPRAGTTLDLQPGRYRLVASHGPFYGVDVRDVVVEAATTTEAIFKLSPAVDANGLICLDLHQHTLASADSAVSMEDRLLSNEAEGLDGFVGGDHNAILDYRPVMDRPGAPRMLVVSGDEASKEGVAHFSSYPLIPQPDDRLRGAIDMRGRGVSDVVSALRAQDQFSDKVIQLNHPRTGDVGYFNQIGFDAQSPTLPKEWEGGFDAIEVLSSRGTAQVDAVLRDWFSLLNRGLRYTAVGGSDAHMIARTEAGYPRTCFSVTGQKSVDAKWLVHAIRADRNAFVTTAPLVRISAGGKQMGELVDATKGRARFQLRVEAAPWVDVKRVELFVNGSRRGKPIAVNPTRDPVRFDDTLELKVTEDSYLVVVVRGEDPLVPVLLPQPGAQPPLPIAVTNPIYFDKDGDGKFTSPRK